VDGFSASLSKEPTDGFLLLIFGPLQPRISLEFVETVFHRFTGEVEIQFSMALVVDEFQLENACGSAVFVVQDDELFADTGESFSVSDGDFCHIPQT
jgi:hypothetical protein